MKYLTMGILMSSLVYFNPAMAGSSTGLITRIYTHVGDVAIFAAGSHVSKPSCSTAGNDWAFSLTTSTGKSMFAILLSAQARKVPVTVAGSNACTVFSDRETPNYIFVE